MGVGAPRGVGRPPCAVQPGPARSGGDRRTDRGEPTMTVIDATPTTTDTRVETIFTDVLGSILEVLERHRVTWAEYRAATEWLAQVATQGELPLLLDVFLSSTVEGLNTSADGGTETNIEGPFYLPDAPILEPPFVLPKR